MPDVDPVYAKYPITKKTRYCEMFLVIDNAIVSKGLSLVSLMSVLVLYRLTSMFGYLFYPLRS